ncbi:MAG: alkaline phosphatase [Kosmotoga sp.]|nr:MAG: alkaline phosphatase [Kosmotoga sp.]
MKKLLLIMLLSLMLVTLVAAAGYTKNVILLIGDGMGINQVLLTSFIEGRDLNMMKAPYFGSATTYSANSNVTDSAAAGTGLSTGFKTNNGMIGMLPDGTIIPTIAEIAAQNGVKTGIVATCRVTHATPASFYGHVESRDYENKLAEQLVNSPLDVVLGGGSRHFVPSGGKRTDGKDLIALAQSKGFDYITTKTELENYEGDRLLGLFASSHLDAVTERSGEQPLLPEMTKKALDILSKDGKPFFLMVEGSQIDWECHGNDVYGVWKETVEFDNAVKVALDFAKENPNTLVIVTADHETGGLGLSTGGYTINLEKIRNDYTKTADWLFYNYGDSVESLKDAMKKYCNVEMTEEDVELFEKMSAESYYGGPNSIGTILSKHVDVGWTTYDHTAAPVPVFAFGPGADSFTGIFDQTYIPRMIGKLAGYELIYPVHQIPAVGEH